MEYEVGSIADLISGNHTPNRRKVAKKPLTPVKLPPLVNVTPATPRDQENIKSRTPRLAFTPEVPLKSATKINAPARDQFESPKSVPKKRKSKLSNNFQFLSQLPDHSDSGNEGFGEDDETGEVEEFLGMKKSKKYTKQEGKRVIKEYYIGKEELNGNPPKGKLDQTKQKNNKNLSKEKVEETSHKKKKNKDVYVEPIVIQNVIVSQEKKSKKKKNKETTENEIELEPLPQKNKNSKKNRKPVSENDTEHESFEGKVQDSGSENTSDDELPPSDNEMEINEELEENVPESEDDNHEDIPQTDFQRAASRRVEKKLQKEEKFSPDEIDKTLFVGNIPVSVLQKNHEKILRHKFSPYGGIESVRIRNIPLADFKTKPKVALIEKKFHAERTTVTAYIKFRNASSVQKALVENNSLLEGNHLRVDRCYQDKKVPVDTRKTIFLGNLPFNIEEETLREVFSNCGQIVSVRLVRDRQTQIGKGIGFINFEKSDGVELAMSMSEEDLLLKKKAIRVQRYNASNNKRENPRDNKNKREGKRNQGENRVVGKRYQKFHPEPVVEQYKPNYGKKRDEQGNKKRKRNLEGNSENRQKQNNAEQTEGGATSEPSSKKFKKHNSESEGNTADHNNGEEHAVANNSEGAKDNATDNSKDESRPSRKERSIDFKGLIAKKKKKFKMNKAILKKKKISKILLHDANN